MCHCSSGDACDSFISLTWLLGNVIKGNYCYGDISYHTPKMDSSNLSIFARLARSEKTTRFLRDIWQTDCKPRTACTSFVWLPFSANTMAFTYHPLFEFFFHRSYLKTTTIINWEILIWILSQRKQKNKIPFTSLQMIDYNHKFLSMEEQL